MALPNLSFLFRSLDGDDDARDDRHGDHRPRRDRSVREVPPSERTSAEEARAEAQLAAQVRTGAPSAFDEVFHRYFASLVSYVRRFVDSTDVAEDIAQDALIHLWNMRESVHPNVSLAPLLRTMVRRAALNRLRDMHTADRVQEFLLSSGDASDVLSSTPVPQSGVEHDDIVRVVRTALMTLPPRTRLVATMHWLDELGRQEIALELSVSVRTIDAQLYQAAAKIRRVLRPYFEGPHKKF